MNSKFKAPAALGLAIEAAKTKKELGPLIETYKVIYGEPPGILYKMLEGLPDVMAPQHVEVLIREDGQTLWVNVDGVCKFRACKIGKVKVNDQRVSKTKGKKI